MSSVREINDLETLASYRLQWSALLGNTPGASFFHSLDWLETYWRHFGADRRLRVLVVYSADRCVGILPLVVRVRRTLLGAARVLTYPLDDWGSFYGPIGPYPTATLLAALGHVRRTRRDWDLLELPWVDTRGTDRGRTLSALDQTGLPATVEPWQTSALVDLSSQQNWHSFWGSRTSRWRNNVRRSEKKLAELGWLTYVRYRPAGATQGEDDPRWDWYDDCERIAGASWQAGSETGTTLTHGAIRPFLRDLHRVAAKAGALDLNLLLIDGRPVAFNYAYQYAGYVFGLRTGFDAQLAPHGAGSVLQARMIEDCFVRGDHTYDLGPGYLDCKRYWQTHTRASDRYTHFPRHLPRAQIARAKRSVERWLKGGQRAAKTSDV